MPIPHFETGAARAETDRLGEVRVLLAVTPDCRHAFFDYRRQRLNADHGCVWQFVEVRNINAVGDWVVRFVDDGVRDSCRLGLWWSNLNRHNDRFF